MLTCPFCGDSIQQDVVIEGDSCLVIETHDPVLVGSVMIIPREHRETVFDLAAAEWRETGLLLLEAKARISETLAPDGYNVGWNCYPTGGQDVMHAHLHVVPRFSDEPLAGRGIRHHLKQPANRR